MSIFSIICKKTSKINKTQGGAYCTNNIVQKCLSIAVSMFLVLSMVPQNAFGLDNYTVDGSGNWTINNEAGLKAFRDAVNGGNNFSGKTVTLAADLDFTNDTASWEPIGNDYNKSFRGTFNGGSHTIDGLHINNGASEDYQGLFGYVDDGEITDLKLTNVKIDVGTGSFVGGICGYFYSSSYSSYSISNCTFSGTITGGSQYVGGICGSSSSSSSSSISNCTFSGTITGGSQYVGGICGASSSSISNCTAEGEVKGGNKVGGICGDSYSSSSSISNCTFSGTITGGSQYVGGICGNSSSSSISNCTVSGTITGGNRTGGIAGGVYEVVSITSCAVFADISGEVSVAGICGSKANVTNCYAVGNITGKSEVGGIMGGTVFACPSGRVGKSCFFAGTLKGTGHEYQAGNPVCYVGGISGYDVSDSFENCVCLASKIEGTGNPDVDIIGYITAAYSTEKPGSSGGGPVSTGNDSNCYYRSDLSGTTGTSYDGEAFALEPGWQKKIFSDTLGWDTETWGIPDETSPDYSPKALPTLKTLPNTIEQVPSLDEKKAPKSSDFTFTLPDDLDYDGQSKVITIAPKEGITEEMIGTINVKYYKVNADGSLGAASTDAPIDAGRYKVKFDVSGGTEYYGATDLPAMF